MLQRSESSRTHRPARQQGAAERAAHRADELVELALTRVRTVLVDG